ncbi:MAG: nucleotidyltransferase domain-containing protein [Chromatiaceae bacterium]|nr:MAG: nucleotidyltransferase domain-containing protein [Chromatiaceae bacterium]
MTETRPFGLAPSVIARLRAELARTAHLQRALIFGSRAKGNYRRGSDIDIALFGPELTPAEVLDLDRRIDDLLLPYQVDICLADTLENPALLAHIQRVGQPIYPAR